MSDSTHTARTTVRDAVLAGVSGRLDSDAVAAVEWAAVDDTRAAIRGRHELVDFAEFVARGTNAAAAEVTL